MTFLSSGIKLFSNISFPQLARRSYESEVSYPQNACWYLFSSSPWRFGDASRETRFARYNGGFFHFLYLRKPTHKLLLIPRPGRILCLLWCSVPNILTGPRELLNTILKLRVLMKIPTWGDDFSPVTRPKRLNTLSVLASCFALGLLHKLQMDHLNSRNRGC